MLVNTLILNNCNTHRSTELKLFTAVQPEQFRNDKFLLQ